MSRERNCCRDDDRHKIGSTLVYTRRIAPHAGLLLAGLFLCCCTKAPRPRLYWTTNNLPASTHVLANGCRPPMGRRDDSCRLRDNGDARGCLEYFVRYGGFLLMLCCCGKSRPGLTMPIFARLVLGAIAAFGGSVMLGGHRRPQHCWSTWQAGAGSVGMRRGLKPVTRRRPD